MNMDSALRIIMAASPVAAGEAFVCLRALNARSPMIGARFNNVVKIAFSDPDAAFTPEQRAAITELIDISSGRGRHAQVFRANGGMMKQGKIDIAVTGRMAI